VGALVGDDGESEPKESKPVEANMAERELDLSPWDGIVDPVGWYSKF
jgi:hypothetical protein